MKGNLLLLCFLASAITAFSQFEKGKKFIGPGFNVSRQETNSSSQPQESYYEHFNVELLAGKFVRRNLVVGIIAAVGRSNSHGINSANSYTGGLFARRYFPLKGRFNLIGHSTASYTNHRNLAAYYTSNTMVEKRVAAHRVNLGVNPALAFTVTPRFQVELLLPQLVSVGYYRENSTIGEHPLLGNKVTSLYLNTNLNLGSLGSTALAFRFIF